MAVTLSQGPRGLEVPHVWTPGDGSPAIQMNLLSAVPRTKFNKMPGFRSLPDAEDNRSPKTARAGEITYPSLVRGKTWTVEGVIQARSIDEARDIDAAMVRAFGERDLLGTWSAIPIAATEYWFCTARVLQYEPDTEFTASLTHPRGPAQIPFLLGLRMSDPRFYWTTLVDTGEFAESVEAINLGNAPTDPIVRVPGSGSGVTITNTTTGKRLEFVGMPGSGTLVVDFAARTATRGGVDVLPYLNTYTSTWWDRGQPGLRPGSNVISEVGGGSVGVTFRHASW